ncbi:MAG: dTDP-4-dehydrorhamnose 3,5-epimerase [Candidatus Binataceae bacterium]|jgi:dTDP-4-dehydrorhamnose 3,5-epimerase
MKFTETELSGAYIINPELRSDERGFFARAFCEHEFRAHGINPAVAQCNLSFNRQWGTLRGMHNQREPHREAKLVRCTAGAIYDVIIDLRCSSPTFRRWISVELSSANHQMIYVPEGFAHGYLTLTDNAEIFYQVSEFYAPGSERGIRWDDPAFGIRWPIQPRVISEKDRSHPDFLP